MRCRLLSIFILFVLFLTACSFQNPSESIKNPSVIPSPTSAPTAEAVDTSEPVSLSITLGDPVKANGISLDGGGDVDTIPVEIEGVAARQSGNGIALMSVDGNNIPDNYLQFNVDDSKLFKGSPTSRVRLEVDFVDSGVDTFSLQYDAQPTAGFNGVFAGGGSVVKSGSGEIKTAVFNLCDAYFGNRDNGADFRIVDDGNGAEIIKEVRLLGLDSALSTVYVDDFGADPMDDQPDSDAIQAALDSTCSGDTVVFTSGRNTVGYKGYFIDKTLFLSGMSAKHDLTFTSSDIENHALLKATADLKGFVVQLFARSRFNDTRNLYNINFGYIDIHGGRDVRVCMGADGVGNGADDNWGSWLPECDVPDDAWCSPGNLAINGVVENVVVHDLIDEQGECGTGLAFNGRNGTIENVTIDTVGDHVHASGCVNTDDDGDYGGWSDGITLAGPGNKIINNTIINPSDIGIVHFGGKDVTIANNTIKITAGNYGAFGAIALHPWDQADTSGVKITDNTIISEGDTYCGGLHTGIDIGPHMWGGACLQSSRPGSYGNPSCSNDPEPAEAAPCSGGTCQEWLFLPQGGTLTMTGNSVTGAHINYLIEGLIIEGQFIDENNTSNASRQSDWEAARLGCNGIIWGPKDKVAHHPSLSGYTDITIHCER